MTCNDHDPECGCFRQNDGEFTENLGVQWKTLLRFEISEKLAVHDTDVLQTGD